MNSKRKQSPIFFAIMKPCNKAAVLRAFFRSTSHRFFKITPKIFNMQ